MITIDKIQSRMYRAMFAVRDRYQQIEDRDRGDVPGWVLITIMTAGLVTALWATAQGALTGLFSKAVNGVTGGN